MKNFYYRASGYGIFILPPWPVSLKVNAFRAECCKIFNLKKVILPPVHITIGNLFAYNSLYERNLIKNLSACTRSIVPFEQTLQNFGSFKSHTVFLNAVQNPGISELNYASSFFCNRKKHYRYTGKISTFKPHLSISYRDLTDQLYPTIWEEYKDQQFEMSFGVQKFTLAKWDAVTFSWKNVHEFSLDGSKPLTLFS